MVYQATVIQVMIASPGDVDEERKIIREVIHDWNDVNSAVSKIMLSPVGWETHSSPELGERPQELINKRILKNCDLLVGVFWTRLGTPTGKADSGTVEEIDEHLDAGKPVMIYFSAKPVVPQSIDGEQFEAVKSLKEKYRKLGIVQEFDNATDFRTKFSKQLSITINSNEYIRKLIESTLNVNLENVDSNSEEETKINLSDDALKLLRAAAIRDDGSLIISVTLGGRTIHAGGQKFGSGRGEEAARWESALKELERNELVVARGYKGEVFELTLIGWQMAKENLK